MVLTRLIYYSSVAATISEGGLRDIILAARRNNEKLGLTGMLACDGRYFLQVLEGDRKTVTKTFLTIARDPRHDNLVLASCDEVDRRLFPKWWMGAVSDEEAIKELCFVYAGERHFQPPNMTPKGMLKFIVALAERVGVRKAMAAA